jgi:hypothetical protein
MGLLRRRHFRLHVDAVDFADQQHGQNDPDDAERIGDRVGQTLDHGSIIGRPDLHERLLGGREAGGVGGGAGEQTHPGGQVHASAADEAHRDQGAQQHNAGRKPIQDQAARPQGAKEPGTDLQAEGVNKDNQPKLPHEFQDMVIDGQLEVPQEKADKQHAGHPETHAPELDFSQSGSGSPGHPEQDDGACH